MTLVENHILIISYERRELYHVRTHGHDINITFTPAQCCIPSAKQQHILQQKHLPEAGRGSYTLGHQSDA